MSDNVRPEIAAFRELELVVRRAAHELATARQRPGPDLLDLPVEDSPAGGDTSEVQQLPDLRPFDLERRLAAAERENALLRERLATARARTRQMLERVHFLRQQTQAAGER